MNRKAFNRINYGLFLIGAHTTDVAVYKEQKVSTEKPATVRVH